MIQQKSRCSKIVQWLLKNKETVVKESNVLSPSCTVVHFLFDSFAFSVSENYELLQSFDTRAEKRNLICKLESTEKPYPIFSRQFRDKVPAALS